MKGYKAFEEGLVCRGKQYAENTVFEEDSAKPCKSGMRFCKEPLAVLRIYNAADAKEFAKVEALDEALTDNGVKFCTKKLKIGAKLSLRDLVKEQIEYVKENCTNENNVVAGKSATAGNSGAATAGNFGAATAGEYGAATAGEYGAATAGNYGYALSGGRVSVGMEGAGLVRGEEPMAKGGLGAVLVLVREKNNGDIKHILQIAVDGEKVKENTWYTLNEQGELTEAEQEAHHED